MDSAEKLESVLADVNDFALRAFVRKLMKTDRKFRNAFFRTFDENFEDDGFEDEFDNHYY